MPVTIYLPVVSIQVADLLLATDVVVPGVGDVVKNSARCIMILQRA